jgi:hypothetical protein
MRERTGILRVVKCLLRLEMRNDFNAKTRLLAKEIVSKIKEDKQFLQKVVRGIKERVDQQLPGNITSDPQYASLWSRQVQTCFGAPNLLDTSRGTRTCRDTFHRNGERGYFSASCHRLVRPSPRVSRFLKSA